MKTRLYLFISLLLLSVQLAFADCPQFYPVNTVIDVPNSVELCNSFYAVKYDIKIRGPIISVEKFREGDSPTRINSFHSDVRLPKAIRSVPSDYTNTNYDRGHLTPAGNSISSLEMRETFLMSNMTPQNGTLNEVSWRILESKVRNLHPDYIVTGAIYTGYPMRIGPHRVPVPSGYYKLTYKSGRVLAWYAPNVEGARVVPSTVDEIEKASGLVFPKY